ncbi:MAG: class II glutamine amidotransferase [Patescibacteria group bacterium]|nr:class II glutamine amidotransferase [Patescibacteria group bacterium]
MCRLLGVIANKEVDINFSFYLADKPFKKLSEENPDGWGIGYYKNGQAEIHKEGLKEVGEREKYNLERVKSVKSKIIISHVRKATHGDKSTINAHPFVCKNWIFAHNGSVNKDCLKKDLENCSPKGETDSEIYFLVLIQQIEKHKDFLMGIKSGIQGVKKCGNYTGLNFIMSDGRNLFCYRDAANYPEYYSLYYLYRDFSNGQVSFKSKETNQLIELMKSKSESKEKAVLICSEKLTYENWQEIPLGTMIFIDSSLKIREFKL